MLLYFPTKLVICAICSICCSIPGDLWLTSIFILAMLLTANRSPRPPAFAGLKSIKINLSASRRAEKTPFSGNINYVCWMCRARWLCLITMHVGNIAQAIVRAGNARLYISNNKSNRTNSTSSIYCYSSDTRTDIRKCKQTELAQRNQVKIIKKPNDIEIECIYNIHNEDAVQLTQIRFYTSYCTAQVCRQRHKSAAQFCVHSNQNYGKRNE